MPSRYARVCSPGRQDPSGYARERHQSRRLRRLRCTLLAASRCSGADRRHPARTRTDPTAQNAVDVVAPAGVPATQLPLALRTRPHEGCPCLASRVRFFGCRSSAQPNSPRRGAVTVTVGLVAAAATNRLPPPTCRSGWCRRVPMLYGTRRGSRPALLPRVCGVTREFVTRCGALDGRGEPGEGDSHLRAVRPDDDRDNGSPRPCAPAASSIRSAACNAARRAVNHFVEPVAVAHQPLPGTREAYISYEPPSSTVEPT